MIELHISESERAERGRKGDLDQYERLDGDRNQTTKYLAIKKVIVTLVCSYLNRQQNQFNLTTVFAQEVTSSIIHL